MPTRSDNQNKRYHDSLRLPGWDYTSKAHYYITTVTYNRKLLFGKVVDDGVLLSAYGQIVHNLWLAAPTFHSTIQLHDFVIMTNHLHAIVEITESGGRDLGGIVGGFKSYSARGINKLRGVRGVAVWQDDFYDHIIRDEPDLLRIQQYIADNPAKWAEDEENPYRKH